MMKIVLEFYRFGYCEEEEKPYYVVLVKPGYYSSLLWLNKILN